MAKCTILGCNQQFVTKQQADLHSATDWHCIACGFSDNRELTIENIASPCTHCLGAKQKCIRVDFKRKAYVANGTLSIKENGRWVHYE